MKEYFLISYYQNKLSEAERKLVEDWLQDKANKQLYEEIIRIWESSSKAAIYEQIKLPELKSIKGPGIKHQRRWIAYAAAAIIAIMFTVYNFIDFGQTPEYTLMAQATTESAELKLSDGTIVNLRPQSQLYYSEEFTKDGRHVKLMGEAFFEVTKDINRPFKIEAGAANVEVLGTSFLLKTIEQRSEITVNSGKVRFSQTDKPENSTTLVKGDAAITVNGKITKEAADLNKLAWKTGIFEFKDTPLVRALDLLNEFYEKPVILRTGPQIEGNITAFFDNEELEDILEVFCITCNLVIADQGDYYELKANDE